MNFRIARLTSGVAAACLAAACTTSPFSTSDAAPAWLTIVQSTRMDGQSNDLLTAGMGMAPLLGQGTINQGDFSIMGLVVSLVGAVILLGIVNLFTRGKAR